MRKLHLLFLAGCAATAALGQDKPAASKLEFEVATIKPSEPIDGMMGKVMVRIGVRNDGAMVTYNRMTLKQLVQNAYDVKDYQVTGAPWMDQQQYDISAKIPDGANKDQAPEMLQNLLKERFKLEFHRDTKEHAVYALVAPKGAGKLKVADPNNALPLPPGATPPPPPPPGDRQVTGGGGGGASAGASGGSMTARRDGPGGGSPQGLTMMRMGPNGGQMEIRAINLGNLADRLARYVGKPVVDQTGIEGLFDFSLSVSPEEMGSMMPPGAMGMMKAQAAAGGPGPEAGRGPEPPNAPEGGSIFQSIQSYGLKLEPKKAPVEMIVIDSADKNPVQN